MKRVFDSVLPVIIAIGGMVVFFGLTVVLPAYLSERDDSVRYFHYRANKG